MRRVTVLALLFFAAAGCSKLDSKVLENAIVTALKAKGVGLKSITCPPDRPLKQGDEFTCSGVDGDDQALTFHVSQTDSVGSTHWEVDGVIVDQQKKGDSIESKIGESADVRCPPKVVVMKVGAAFSCPVQVEGAMHVVEITIDNDKTDVHWKILS
jgi:hypothetical protein